MEAFTDGVVRKALAYMGYSTLQANMFMATAYQSDKSMVVLDAAAAGFDLQQAIALDNAVVRVDTTVDGFIANKGKPHV